MRVDKITIVGDALSKGNAEGVTWHVAVSMISGAWVDEVHFDLSLKRHFFFFPRQVTETDDYAVA
jgi:hypothetical protein